MMPAISGLADILRRRNVKRLHYFHTDHFEPWSRGLNEATAKAVERFFDMSRSSRFGRKLSLFYSAYVPYSLDLKGRRRAGGNRVAGDAVWFRPRSAEVERLARDVIGPLFVPGSHEPHLHVHHEFWTLNESNFDTEVSRWVNANSTAEMDRARLDLFFGLCMTAIRNETNHALDRWAFIHGNWALAASDPRICTIDNELELIMRHGGFGDFSFPAGRAHCDPKLEEPFTCRPIFGRRPYDDPESDPRPVLGGPGLSDHSRFFIWNSPIKAAFSSLDYYSPANREFLRAPERVVEEWLEKSVLLGNDLLVKTHAHSLKWEYGISEPDALIPHCHPDVIAIFEELMRACDAGGVEFKPVTVNEVMAVLQTHSKPSDDVSTTKAGIQVDRSRGTRHANVGSARLADLERFLAGKCREWLDGDESRLVSSDHYRSLLSGGELLRDYERAMLEHVLATFTAEETRIVEIGTGLGALSIMLAASGYDVVAFEGEPQRFEGARFLASAAAAQLPEVRSNLKTILGWFPDAAREIPAEPSRRNVLLAANVVGSEFAIRQADIMAAVSTFDGLLLDTSRFGVRRYDTDQERQFRETLARAAREMGTVWCQEPYIIRHFRPLGAQARRSEASAEPDEQCGQTSKKVVASAVDPEAFQSEFLALQRHWMAKKGAQASADELYASKLQRGAALEAYEVAVADAITRIFSRDTEIIEIGSGHGALALLLTQRGFRVRGFEGDGRRSDAAAWHVRKFVGNHPALQERIGITPGFFPDALGARLELDGRKRIGLATNVVCNYTDTHQESILQALRAGVDEIVIDLGRFGRNRNAQQERDALRANMAGAGFSATEVVYYSPPYEYWRFRVERSGATAAPVTERASRQDIEMSIPGVQASPDTNSALPKGTMARGTLFSVFGDRHLGTCPVCHGSRSDELWRIPMATLKEPISLFGGYFNQVPTLQVPATVYCFDFCRDCESIYLNPVPASQKDDYRRTDHYIRTMAADAVWQQYEGAFKSISRWFPAGATILMDAACGIGPYLEIARRREPERWRRLIGLELSEKYVQHMRARGLEAHVFDIDNDDLASLVGAEGVDFIAFSEAFEHVERPMDALAKLLSVLRPGGRLYFTAQRYGRDVQAAVRPGEPIYIGEKVIRALPARLGCRMVDVTTSGMRYYVVLER